MSQHHGVVLGVVFNSENQKKTIHERWKVLESVKKRDQSFWPQTLITFFHLFQHSWIVFSDSHYQKLPPKQFHGAVTRCYVTGTNYVPHATSIKFRVVLCRVRLFPTMISKMKWLKTGLSLKFWILNHRVLIRSKVLLRIRLKSRLFLVKRKNLLATFAEKNITPSSMLNNM